jgi:hypothetical protein
MQKRYLSAPSLSGDGDTDPALMLVVAVSMIPAMACGIDDSPAGIHLLPQVSAAREEAGHNESGQEMKRELQH